MAELSLKEKSIAGVALVAILAVALVMSWFFVFSQSWRRAKNAFENERNTDASQKALIAKKGELENDYREEVLKVPAVANADTRCQELIVDLARKNRISVSSNQADTKVEDFDSMKRMDVDITWSGTFDALVRFLYDLETSDVGKFDVKKLNFTADRKNQGRISGKMTLTSIYRLADGTEEE